MTPFSNSSSLRYRTLVIVFWVLAFATVPIYASLEHVGWDLEVYSKAAKMADAGTDLYVQGMSAEKEYAEHRAQHANDPIPLPYLYPPLTLVVLRDAHSLPVSHSVFIVIYCAIYLVAYLALLFVGQQFCTPQERVAFQLLLPAAAFFPGLLQHDNILGGNVSFIFYGVVLTCAYKGWSSGRWTFFYFAVVAGSCCKWPWLTLLAIPVLSAPKQWRSALIAGMVGVGLFLVQPFIWPELFRHFLQACEFELYHQGFGVSPAGIFAQAYVQLGHSFVLPAMIVYGLYAPAVAFALFSLSSRYRNGSVSLIQWAPVLLLGVFLLNPRIKDYDVAPLTIPMALIAWRFITRFISTAKAAATCFGLFILANVIALSGILGDNSWNLMSCFLTVILFGFGCWDLSNERIPEENRPARYQEVEMVFN